MSEPERFCASTLELLVASSVMAHERVPRIIVNERKRGSLFMARSPQIGRNELRRWEAGQLGASPFPCGWGPTRATELMAAGIPDECGRSSVPAAIYSAERTP